MPAHKNESRFKATEAEENKEPAELLGDGQFKLTDDIKKQYEAFDKVFSTNEKCERRITVTGIQPSLPQTIQIEDISKVHKLVEE